MSIKGNTVGTTTPRPDWNQNDSKKADFIKNKPTDLLANTDAHLKNKSNPHGVTASQTGALPTAGGTMAGNIAMNGNKITGLPDPATGSEPLTQHFMNQSMGQMWFNNNTTFDIKLANSRGVTLVALGMNNGGHCLWYVSHHQYAVTATEKLAGSAALTFEAVQKEDGYYLRVTNSVPWSYGFYITTPSNRGW